MYSVYIYLICILYNIHMYIVHAYPYGVCAQGHGVVLLLVDAFTASVHPPGAFITLDLYSIEGGRRV